MHHRFLVIIAFFISASYCNGQIVTDTTLTEVVIKAYFSEKPLLKTPASISVLGSRVFENHSNFSLLPAMNTVAGVRMEERSPGSYRLSIRGSLLRSPFGVRNVKIYFDDFTLTDAGGNTYLNAIDVGSISELEIIKGPEGSVFGANTGGVLLMHSESDLKKDSINASVNLNAASFQLFRENIKLQARRGDFGVVINQSHQKADGYRENSQLKRDFLQLTPRWSYTRSGELRGLFLYADLRYGTPGGLNPSQFSADPKAARPEAVQQNAFVGNKTAYYGLSNKYQLGLSLSHVLVFTGSKTDFDNSAIRNFEERKENTLGLRTYFQLKGQSQQTPFNLQFGIETQRTNQWKDQFVNNRGEKGDLTGSDYLKVRQSFAFFRASSDPLPGLTVETALSYNLFNYRYSASFPVSFAADRSFRQQLLPRFAMSYSFNKHLALRGSLSKGYSAPTLEELKPSGRTLNTLLQAENGWNRELGTRLSILGSRLYWDVVYFNYHLSNAIVRRVGADEAEFYVNAGSTRQTGFESELFFNLLKKNVGFLKALQFNNSVSCYDFQFADFTVEANNYAGNRITGVPSQVVLSSVYLGFSHALSLFAEHNYTSSIPLNDANSFSATAYNLFNIRLSKSIGARNLKASVFIGADNIFNQIYSLGNDLNAPGNRYYNAAPGRSCFVGISLKTK